MARGVQYRLLAYVCGHDCVRRIDDEATRTISRIFIERPSDCRYAVVGRYNIVQHADDVLVFDLYRLTQKTRSGLIEDPDPISVHTDLDAAIMATAMLYEDDN